MNMTHAHMVNTADIGQRNDTPLCTCTGSLTPIGPSFHSDVSWEVFRCTSCGEKVFAVGGRRHWWNYSVPALHPDPQDDSGEVLS